MKGHKHKTLVSWLFNIRMMVVAVYALHQKRMCSYTLNLSVSVNHSVSNIIGLFLLSYCQLSTIVLDPIWYHVCLLHMDNLHNIRLALISWASYLMFTPTGVVCVAAYIHCKHVIWNVMSSEPVWCLWIVRVLLLHCESDTFYLMSMCLLVQR